MPEITQPQPVHQMSSPRDLQNVRLSSEQPRPTQKMTAEPARLRGGGTGEKICCGCCAACCACEAFECFECCEGLCDG